MSIAKLIGKALGEEDDRGNQNMHERVEQNGTIDAQASQMRVNKQEIRIVVQNTTSFGSNISESEFALSRQETMIRDNMSTPDGDGFVLLEEPLPSEG